MSSSPDMIPPPLRPRRHARRISNQRPFDPQVQQSMVATQQRRSARPHPPTAPSPHTPTPPRRRKMYHPPQSVSTHHAQVRHLHEELRDITQNLAVVQQRIQQLESVPSAESHTPKPRPLSVVYRLPDLDLDTGSDFAHFHLDDFIHASPPTPVDSASPCTPTQEDSKDQLGHLPRPDSQAWDPKAVQRRSHQRDVSVATVQSFASYNTEDIEVCEASTAAVFRPCFRTVSQRESQQEAEGHVHPQTTAADDENVKRPPPRTSSPFPYARKRQQDFYPRRISSLPQTSVTATPAEAIKIRPSWPGLARPGPQSSSPNWRPVSCHTRLQSDELAAFPSTPSSAWVTDSQGTDELADITSMRDDWPLPSPDVAAGDFSTPYSAQRPRWLHSSPPPSEEPQLDSSCTSISDSSPAAKTGRPTTPVRLNLFPKIQQSSSESLQHQCQSEYSEDPFYAGCGTSTICQQWTPSPAISEPPSTAQITERGSTRQSCGVEPAAGQLDRPRRKDHRLRGFLSPGVKRQQRDTGTHTILVRSPRRKLRTFLRRFTPPNLNKTRHSMPATSQPSGVVSVQSPTTPPRLPTRRGSTLPFDESLLGELTKISARREPSAAPSPARRVRNSMHDAAGLTLSKTAATHAHWRAQRSRSSMLSTSQLRSRAPTTSTMSSGPSFYFLPKVDQMPTTPRRRAPVHRQRMSRY